MRRLIRSRAYPWRLGAAAGYGTGTERPAFRAMRQSGLAVAALLLLACSTPAQETQSVGDWLDRNEPIVIDYLLSLRPAQIGQALDGVVLSDGSRELGGYVFLGQIDTPQPGVHAYRFRAQYGDSTFEIHFIWVEPGGTPFGGVSCAGRWIEPGGYAVLSGDVYIEGQIQPGHLVVTTCKL